MEDLIETLTRGNPTEVKVVLASVALALGGYQLVLIAVGYGKLRPRFLSSAPASKAHRASGDAIVVLLVVVAAMCIDYFGFEDATAHIAAGTALLGVLALKIPCCAASTPQDAPSASRSAARRSRSSARVDGDEARRSARRCRGHRPRRHGDAGRCAAGDRIGDGQGRHHRDLAR